MTIWPKYENGQWFTVYDTEGKGNVQFPVQYPDKDAMRDLISKHENLEVVGKL